MESQVSPSLARAFAAAIKNSPMLLALAMDAAIWIAGVFVVRAAVTAAETSLF